MIASKRLQTWFSLTLMIGVVALFLFLREVSSGRFIIDPIAFSLGSVEIRWYGIIIAIGIVLALEWTMRRAKLRGLDLRLVERAAFTAILGGIAGARLIYVAQNISYFTAHADRILAFSDGGLSIHGALLGGALALWISIAMSRPKIPLNPPLSKGEDTPSFHKGGLGRIFGFGHIFSQIADAAVPGLLLAMILGRLGNFANAELYGPPADLPWKLFIPEAARPVGLESMAFYHPTFLYDIILNTVVLLLLLKFESRLKKPGQLTLWFFLGIAITRFIVEFWRLGDSAALGLSLAQLVSLLIVLGVSLALLIQAKRLQAIA